MVTYGWDLVYSLSMFKVNEALALGSEHYITTFDYSASSQTLQTTTTIKGQFGEWQIVGGSESVIELQLPITSGNLSMSGAEASVLLPNGPIDLTGVVVEVSITPSLMNNGDGSGTYEMPVGPGGHGPQTGSSVGFVSTGSNQAEGAVGAQQVSEVGTPILPPREVPIPPPEHGPYYPSGIGPVMNPIGPVSNQDSNPAKLTLSFNCIIPADQQSYDTPESVCYKSIVNYGSVTSSTDMSTLTSNLITAIPALLVQNNSAINYIFTTIEQQPGSNTPMWLTPQTSQYYFTVIDGFQSQYLTIMSKTAAFDYGAQGAQQQNAVDTSYFIDGTDGYFAISKVLFMAYVLMPYFETIIPNAVDPMGSSLSYDGLSTITGTLPLPPSSVESLDITFHPQIQNYTIALCADLITIVATGTCAILTSTLTFSITTTSKITYLDGKISIVQQGNPETTHSIDLAEQYLFPVINVIITEVCGNSVFSSLATSTQEFSTTTISPQDISWSGVGGFVPANGGVNDGFWLSGTVSD